MILITDTTFFAGKTDKFLCYIQCYDGKFIRWVLDRQSLEVRVRLEDCAACMGYTADELLAKDSSLDAMNNFRKRNPGAGLFGEIGSDNVAFQKGEIFGLAGTWMIFEDVE